MSGSGQLSRLQDDEELARMLQYQEQALVPSSPSRKVDATKAFVANDDQETRDFQFARDMARNDLEGSATRINKSGHTNRARRSSQHDALQVQGYESLTSRQRSQSYGGFSPETADRARMGLSPRKMVVGAESQAKDPLAYARLLQEEAFRSLEDRPSANQADYSALECSDMELAWRMQESEISASNNNGSSRFEFGFCKNDSSSAIHFDEMKMASASSASLKLSQEEEDLRLARYLEVAGTSKRDLSAAEFTSNLGSAHESRNSLQASSNTLGPMDRSMAISQCDVTPPANATNSPVDVLESPLILPVASNARLIQSARPAIANNTLRRQPPISAAAPLSAPSQPAGHINAAGLPRLDPIYAENTDTNKGVKKKRRSFLRFGNRKASIPDPALFAMDIDEIPPPGAYASITSSIVPRDSIKQSPVVNAVCTSPRPTRSWLPRSPKREVKLLAKKTIAPVTRTSVGPLPNSVSVNQHVSQPLSQTTASTTTRSRDLVCTSCGQMRGSFLIAMERPYHHHCFRCDTCRNNIDKSTPFAISRNDRGEKRAHHPHCFAKAFAVHCTVCEVQIPASEDDIVSFVRHPFFDKEVMCLRHAESPGRRCTGCHRFEPDNAPFADLNDGDRCLCFACCRTVVVDSADIAPLWKKILLFFGDHLKLPVWDAMRSIPVLVVQSTAMNEAIDQSDSPHKGHSQIMARGLCLTNYDRNFSRHRLVRAPSMRFERSTRSFRSMDAEDPGLAYISTAVQTEGEPKVHIHAILCLSGLPRDLTSSILAHEATHAWIKLHPQYDSRKPLPPQVEEGCAQLISMLLLSDGLTSLPSSNAVTDEGPSDEKLRQYFKFCIERDDSDIFGEGYRCAAAAYRDIGIEALLSHVVVYREFPNT